jgi:hypothetical protein
MDYDKKYRCAALTPGSFVLDLWRQVVISVDFVVVVVIPENDIKSRCYPSKQAGRSAE